MKKSIIRLVAALAFVCASCFVAAAAGCAQNDNLPFMGSVARVNSVSVVYVSSEGFNDGVWDEEAVLESPKFETGETYYMFMDLAYAAIGDNLGKETLVVGLEISPAAVVESTLFNADSGVTDEAVVNDRLRVTVEYKIPEKAGEENKRRIIMRLKPKKVDYALFSYGFCENDGDPFDSAVRERLTLTYGANAYTEGLKYVMNGDGYHVAGIGSANTRIVKVPQKYEGKPVTGVAESAFKSNLSIVEVILPEGIESVGINAFNGCKGLENIVLPDTVASIGESAFQGCICIENITLKGVLDLGRYAFADCSALTSVAVGYGAKVINTGAFKNCSGLVSVDLPLSLNSVSDYAFSGCSSLKEIEIPSSVKTLGDYAFKGCSSLAKITLSDRLTVINVGVFSGCKAVTSITIPASVTAISEQAFSDCSALSSLGIEHGVNTIGGKAFENCTALESVTIPKSVYTINKDAFAGSGLKTANFLQKNGWRGSNGLVDVSDVGKAAEILVRGEAINR